MNPTNLNTLIKKRRSIFPKTYNNEPIPREIVEQVLENANWAPTHRFTEPWRFKVFYGEKALARLGDFLAAKYKAEMPADKFSEAKYKKLSQNPRRSGCAIALCMQRDAEERVPEWEEIASTACAVQNMWLTCTANNVGCYWSSAKVLQKSGEFLNLQEGERCLGLFFMGNHDLPELPGKRKPIGEKVVWIEE